MTERMELGGGVHLLRGAVNMGLVETESGVLALDTGLDRGAANRLIRAAEELGRPLVAIVNTHAHADHHGGNAHLVRRLGIPVFAPAVEEAVIREPRYEPIYLFGGAVPVRALESKFLRAEPSPVDRVIRPEEEVIVDGRRLEVIDLAGHSIAQVGVRVDGVLFAADAFFGQEPLAKHGIPYLVDAAGMEESLRKLTTSGADWLVPGHGEPLDDPGDTLAANLGAIERGWSWLEERLRREAAGTEDLLVEFATRFGLRLADPASYVLNRTTLLGFLGAMERADRVRVVLEGGRWYWSAA